MTSAGWVIDGFSAFGEFLIAGVIYYEVEAHRAAAFLDEVQSRDFYEDRAKLYESYANLPLPSNASLKDRAEAFRKLLWEEENLRHLLDVQWVSFNRLRYSVRRSIFHRHILSKWFPQVIVSFWVMAARYLMERQTLRPTPVADVFPGLVRESLQFMRKRGGLKPISIYSGGRKGEIKISISELAAMLIDPEAPFR